MAIVFNSLKENYEIYHLMKSLINIKFKEIEENYYKIATEAYIQDIEKEIRNKRIEIYETEVFKSNLKQFNLEKKYENMKKEIIKGKSVKNFLSRKHRDKLGVYDGLFNMTRILHLHTETKGSKYLFLTYIIDGKFYFLDIRDHSIFSSGIDFIYDSLENLDSEYPEAIYFFNGEAPKKKYSSLELKKKMNKDRIIDININGKVIVPFAFNNIKYKEKLSEIESCTILLDEKDNQMEAGYMALLSAGIIKDYNNYILKHLDASLNEIFQKNLKIILNRNKFKGIKAIYVWGKSQRFNYIMVVGSSKLKENSFNSITDLKNIEKKYINILDNTYYVR